MRSRIGGADARRPPRLATRMLAVLLALCAVAMPAVAKDPQVVRAELLALPGVLSVTYKGTPLTDVHFFHIGFEQPVDHAQPGGAKFTQLLTLIHRDEAKPMVLVTEGYDVFPAFAQVDITAVLATNQLRVGHRYFYSSMPAEPLDWSKLTVMQSAADLHRVVQAFKPKYGAGWVSNGASKNGMTATLFRYFYPDDVDATVAYVAPTMRSTNDRRFVNYLDTIGTVDCRAALLRFQTEALARRVEVQALIPEPGFGGPGYDFSWMGGRNRAYEFMVLELPFVFWQYTGEANCANIPQRGASAQAIADFIDATVGFDNFDVSTLDYYKAFYYQAAVEFGMAQTDERRVAPLLQYPGEDVVASYPPFGIAKVFDPVPMLLVEDWVRLHGQRMIFVYGANDPWSAAQYAPATANDSYRYVITGALGNHSARLTRLPQPEQDAAFAKLRNWLGLPALKQQALRGKRGWRRGRDVEPVLIAEPTRRELYLR
jgi:hypothetical protein